LKIATEIQDNRSSRPAFGYSPFYISTLDKARGSHPSVLERHVSLAKILLA
jgi:hypothetical protein